MRNMHPNSGLNLAVVNFLLQCAATRSIESMSNIGLDPDEVRDLMNMGGEDLARLSMCTDPLFRIKINGDAWRRVKSNVLRQSSTLRNALILAEAPRAMIERWWPMRHREFASLRNALNGKSAGKRGRPRIRTVANEDEEARIWTSWASRTETRTVKDLLPIDYLQMHEETEVSLAILWPLTNDWASQRLYGDAKQRAAR